MAKDKKVNIVVGAKDAASKKLGRVQKSLGSLKGAVGGLAVAYISLKGAAALWNATIDAAAKQEVIFKKLETAVELTGIKYEDAKYKIDSYLASMQETTRYGDTDMAPVLQQITQLTGSLAKGFEGSKIAADLASSGLFDLNTAARYVAMAMEGEVTVLGRYIPELKTSAGLINENMTATEKWAVAKRLLNEKFAGAAQNDLNTYSGQLNQFNNYLGDMGEAIGDKVLPYLLEMAKGWTEFLRITGLVQEPLKITAENLEEESFALEVLEQRLGEVNTHIMANNELMFQGARSNKEWKEAGKELTEQLTAVEDKIRSKNDAIQLYLNSLKELPAAQQENVTMTDEQIEALGRWELRSKKAVTKIVAENRKATKTITKDWDNAERAKARAIQDFTNNAIGYMDNMQRQLISGMIEGRSQLKDVFKNMAGDFLNLFINTILKDIKLALVAKLIKMLTLFDVRENDLMAIRIGRDYARLFQQGVFGEMDFGGLARGMAGGVSGIGAMQIGRALPAPTGGGVTVIIQGDVIGEDEYLYGKIIPAIERAIALKETDFEVTVG